MPQTRFTALARKSDLVPNSGPGLRYSQDIEVVAEHDVRFLEREAADRGLVGCQEDSLAILPDLEGLLHTLDHIGSQPGVHLAVKGVLQGEILEAHAQEASLHEELLPHTSDPGRQCKGQLRSHWLKL